MMSRCLSRSNQSLKTYIIKKCKTLGIPQDTNEKWVKKRWRISFQIKKSFRMIIIFFFFYLNIIFLYNLDERRIIFT